MKITVAFSPGPRLVHEWTVDLPTGSVARQALLKCGVLHEFAHLELDGLSLGVWGKHCELAHPLNDHDRIEIYRPLRVDPTVARRERFSRQGAKRAGLFANKRSGAKAGYGG